MIRAVVVLIDRPIEPAASPRCLPVARRPVKAMTRRCYGCEPVRSGNAPSSLSCFGSSGHQFATGENNQGGADHRVKPSRRERQIRLMLPRANINKASTKVSNAAMISTVHAQAGAVSCDVPGKFRWSGFVRISSWDSSFD